jgi:hypothetical protein
MINKERLKFVKSLKAGDKVYIEIYFHDGIGYDMVIVTSITKKGITTTGTLYHANTLVFDKTGCIVNTAQPIKIIQENRKAKRRCDFTLNLEEVLSLNFRYHDLDWETRDAKLAVNLDLVNKVKELADLIRKSKVNTESTDKFL